MENEILLELGKKMAIFFFLKKERKLTGVLKMETTDSSTLNSSNADSSILILDLILNTLKKILEKVFPLLRKLKKWPIGEKEVAQCLFVWTLIDMHTLRYMNGLFFFCGTLSKWFRAETLCFFYLPYRPSF